MRATCPAHPIFLYFITIWWVTQSRRSSYRVFSGIIHLTVEARVRSQVGPYEISGGQSGTGAGFFPSNSVFPRQYHSTTYLHLHVAVTSRTNGQSLGTFQSATLFPKSGAIE